jgi:hypothetical protein
MSNDRKKLMMEIYSISEFLYKNGYNDVKKHSDNSYIVEIGDVKFISSSDGGTWGLSEGVNNELIIKELIIIKRDFIINKLNG